MGLTDSIKCDIVLYRLEQAVAHYTLTPWKGSKGVDMSPTRTSMTVPSRWSFLIRHMMALLDGTIYDVVDALFQDVAGDFGIDRLAFFVKENGDLKFTLRAKLGTDLPRINEEYPVLDEIADCNEVDGLIVNPTPGLGFDLWMVIRDENQGLIGYIALDDTSLDREFTNDQLMTFRELLLILDHLIGAKKKFDELRFVDPLTGLNSRRYLEEKNGSLLKGKKSVAILDLDKFKLINDTYGHQVGDEVLARFGEFLRKHFRENDEIVRYGGEEFLLVLNDFAPEPACARLENLIRMFSMEIFEIYANEVLVDALQEVSFSAGIAEVTEASEWESVLKLADDRLYKAKVAGRARAVWQ